MRASSSRHANDTHQNTLYPGLTAVCYDTLRDGERIGTGSSSNRNNRISNSFARPSMNTFKVTDQANASLSRSLHSDLSPSTSPQSFLEPFTNSNGNGNGNGNNGNACSTSKYDWRLHSLVLCRHILTRGLIDGVGSDVKVHVPAWDKVYHLHRLILDQNPYFSLLLQGGFQEASSDSVTLHFEDNPFITADSFYFVLLQLYGKLAEPNITRDNVREILATCSFFHLEHMCELCVEFILRTLNVDNVVEYLVFADENRVHGSDRILDAIFTFLCREAYTMHPEIVAALPLPWIKKVLDSDAFWVPSEYTRYLFALRILTTRVSRISSSSSSSSLSSPSNGIEDDAVVPEPPTEETESFTEETEIQKRSSFAPSPVSPTVCDDGNDDDDKDPASIDADELEIFQDIFLHSIHYMHMTFEQLESIRSDTHPLTGEPVVPDATLKDALWQQIQMRSRIEAASESDTALGFTVYEDGQCNNPSQLIPTDDMTTYTGESALSGSTATASTLEPRRRRSPKHTGGAGSSNGDGSTAPTKQYSIYPPFRFSVEFADFAALKHNVRVYSKTVFYAGSNWNMYIQKTRSQRKGVLQLGVYLHRQSVPFGPCNHDEDASQQQQCTRRCTPELSQFSRYADKRKVVKAWFKIFCPARGPKHTLTLFQSSPDNFSVLQSWGWRSATLCADECLGIDAGNNGNNSSNNNGNNNDEPGGSVHLDDNEQNSTPYAPPPPLHAPASPSSDDQLAGYGSYSGTSLRFSVVMGHI